MKKFKRKVLAMLMTNNFGSSLRQQLFDGAPFCSELLYTAIPQRAAPGTTGTFTRATTATGQKWDEAGYLDFTALAGEAVFKGARREYNQWTTSSVTLASGGNKSLTLTAGTYQFSMGAGTGTATFSGTGGATGTLAASTGRVSVAKTITAGTFVVTASVADLADLQVCNITGETDQTTIRPYVSVGVESAPAYHGSMVDGVKCYDTDRSGNPITQTTTYDAVTLNGVAGTYVSTPDSVAASITGDIDIRVKAALTDWTPSSAAIDLVSKWAAAGNQRSMALQVAAGGSTGRLALTISTNGTATSAAVSTAETGFTDGATGWCRVTRASSTGACNFYTSSDGATWTLLGTADVVTTAGSLFDNTAAVQLGGVDSTGSLAGKIYQAQSYNGINGTLAVDFDASRYAGGTTLTGSTGETWTLQGNAVIHPTNYPLVGYVPWEARTNLCLQSNAFTTTWVNDGLIPVQNSIGPDGGTTAWTLDDNAAGAVERIYQTGITLTAATYTMSVFIKKTSTVPGANSYPLIYATQGANIALATIDPVNGTATVWTTYVGPATVTSSARCTSYNSTYWRVELTFLATAAAWSVAILPAAAAQGQSTGVESAAGVGSQVFYGAQVELGAFASSYIATTTAAATRNADQLYYTGADIANIKTLAAIGFKRDVGVTVTGYVAAVSNGAALTEYAGFYLASAGTAARFAGTDGGVGQWDQAASNAYTPGTDSDIAQSWATNSVRMSKDGVAQTADTTATTPSPTQLDIGNIGGHYGLNGYPGTVYGWTRNLSQSELNAITS